jgi:hypothetical protein
MCVCVCVCVCVRARACVYVCRHVRSCLLRNMGKDGRRYQLNDEFSYLFSVTNVQDPMMACIKPKLIV